MREIGQKAQMGGARLEVIFGGFKLACKEEGAKRWGGGQGGMRDGSHHSEANCRQAH